MGEKNLNEVMIETLKSEGVELSKDDYEKIINVSNVFDNPNTSDGTFSIILTISLIKFYALKQNGLSVNNFSNISIKLNLIEKLFKDLKENIDVFKESNKQLKESIKELNETKSNLSGIYFKFQKDFSIESFVNKLTHKSWISIIILWVTFIAVAYTTNILYPSYVAKKMEVQDKIIECYRVGKTNCE